MATALDPIVGWDPARRVLTLADTVYSVALDNSTQRVSIFVVGAVDARYRVTDAAMGADDNWQVLQAGRVSSIRMSRASHGDTRILHLATGGTSVVVRILPEAAPEV